jgi:anti-anti-sigma factor
MLAEAIADSSPDDRHAVIEIRTDGEGPPRLVVSGDIDAVSARRLQQSVIDVLRRHPPAELSVDLAGVTFLDSAGIEALLRCRVDAEQVECRLSLANPGPTTYRLLQIAGLLEQFGLVKPRRSDAGASRPAGAALGLVNCGLAG